MSVPQNLLLHAVTFQMGAAPGAVPVGPAASVPRPSELEPYAWTDVPADFGRVRGFGGATTYRVTSRDCGYTITCKRTDTTHSFLHAFRAQILALAPGSEQRFTITEVYGDTGAQWVGMRCTFAEIPPEESKETPTVVTWTFNVEELMIVPPSASILPSGI
jgi:hypothetical protein